MSNQQVIPCTTIGCDKQAVYEVWSGIYRNHPLCASCATGWSDRQLHLIGHEQTLAERKNELRRLRTTSFTATDGE